MSSAPQKVLANYSKENRHIVHALNLFFPKSLLLLLKLWIPSACHLIALRPTSCQVQPSIGIYDDSPWLGISMSVNIKSLHTIHQFIRSWIILLYFVLASVYNQDKYINSVPLYDIEMFQLWPGVHTHHIVMLMNAIFYFCCPEKGNRNSSLKITCYAPENSKQWNL